MPDEPAALAPNPSTPAPAATAAKAIVGALVRQAVTIAGTALVAHRMVDRQTADAAVGPIADYVLGAGLAIGSAYWSVLRARLMHSRWVQAWIAPARPLAGAVPDQPPAGAPGTAA